MTFVPEEGTHSGGRDLLSRQARPQGWPTSGAGLHPQAVLDPHPSTEHLRPAAPYLPTPLGIHADAPPQAAGQGASSRVFFFKFTQPSNNRLFQIPKLHQEAWEFSTFPHAFLMTSLLQSWTELCCSVNCCLGITNTQ